MAYPHLLDLHHLNTKVANMKGIFKDSNGSHSVSLSIGEYSTSTKTLLMPVPVILQENGTNYLTIVVYVPVGSSNVESDAFNNFCKAFGGDFVVGAG